MDDIFEEIQEDLREEKLRNLWSQYGKKILIALAALMVLMVSILGVRHFQEKNHAIVAEKFLEAHSVLEQGNTALALEKFQALEAEKDATYRTLARLFLSSWDGFSAKEKAGFHHKIAQDAAIPLSLRDYSRLMGIVLQVDSAESTDLAEFLKELEPLTKENHPLAGLAYELSAAIYYHQGDKAATLAALERAMALAGDNRTLRLRALHWGNQISETLKDKEAFDALPSR